jgi:carboxymethylenebutenolidase
MEDMVVVGAHLRAFLAVPPGRGPHPGVVLLHERYGLVQHTLDLAQRFAKDGYVCLAPDLFSAASAAERERLHRGEIRKTLPDPQVGQDLSAAVEWLRGRQEPAVGDIAVMGVCQTARYAFLAAARRPAVGACLVFYGAAQAREWDVNDSMPEPLEAIIARGRAPVLGVFGELDHLISVEDVLRLRAVLERHRRSYRIDILAEAPHGWLNDTMPGRYRRPQAEAAWQLALTFLRDAFGGSYPADRVRSSFASSVSTTYDFASHPRLE